MRQIFLHGLGQGPESWEGVLSHLVDKPACPDLYAFFGGKEAAYQNLYRGFSDYCGGEKEPLALCGLSLGAVLSLHYALDHPERVGALLLAAPQYKMPGGLLTVQNLIFRLMPAKAFGEMGLGKEEVIALTGSMKEIDLSPGLGDLACPTLILCGERDRTNRKAALALAKALPNARFREVKGAGHELNREAPEELAAIWTECISLLFEKKEDHL